MGHPDERSEPEALLYTRREFLVHGARAFLGAPLVMNCWREAYDLLILGADVFDGTGTEPVRADVAVRAEKIAAVGKLSHLRARRVVQASGMALAPGFIDVHSHTDVELLVDGRAQSKVQQGVTTEISGNCGESPFPLLGEEGERLREGWRERYGVTVDWRDASGFFRRLQRSGISVNYASLLGHGTVRACVMGQANRSPSPEEWDKMRKLVLEALGQGVLGLSFGLEYAPGAFARTEEVVQFAGWVAEKHGVCAVHLRNEDFRLLEAVDEALEMARQSGCSLQISHLKASQPRNWPLQDSALERIRLGSERGVNVHVDCYPYIAFGTTAQVLFPMWSREGGVEAFLGKLRDGGTWPQMAAFALDKVQNLGGWQNILISRLPDTANRAWQGKRVDELARQQGLEPLDFLRRLLVDARGDVSIVAFAMSEENLEKVLAFRLTMIGSDGNAVSPEGILGRGHPHPRYYGTFPRVLGRYVRERGVLPLSQAIHRMTGLPARKFGLEGRGRIAPGHFADLVLFDPGRIADCATFEDPHRFPQGIRLVAVNGEVVVEEGQHTGAKPGKVLACPG